MRADSTLRASGADRRGRAAAWGRGIAVPVALSAVLVASAPTPAAHVEAPEMAGVLPASAFCVSGSDQVQATLVQQKRVRRKQWARLHRGGEGSEGNTGRTTPDGHADGR